MVNVHSCFLEELSMYLKERGDAEAKEYLAQIDLYFNNPTKVEGYQEETLAFVTKELTN